MAIVAAFRGVRYATDDNRELTRRVSPPYDVISDEQLTVLRGRSPFNATHVDLPNVRAEGRGDKYADGGELWRSWLVTGVVRREDAPALYVYQQRYRVADRTVVLTGFIGALKLVPFSEGIVLPHEHTFAKPKADRLRLMAATEANLSAIYGFYSDPELGVERVMAGVTAQAPTASVRDDDGNAHELWAVTDPTVWGKITAIMSSRQVFIADGHHRYETALDYAQERQARAGKQADAGWNFIMMMMANVDAGGLTVLPTHRIVQNMAVPSLDAVGERLSRWYEVVPVSLATVRGEGALPAHMYMVGGGRAWRLVPRDKDAVAASIESSHSLAWKRLAVSQLHHVVLTQGLGLSEAMQDSQEYIRYTRLAEQVIEATSSEGSCGFVLPAPSGEEVRQVALAGDAMPHKSTYFYPKLLTGLVFNDLNSPVELGRS